MLACNIRHSVLSKAIAIAVVCLLLRNDLAFALAPPSKFKQKESISGFRKEVTSRLISPIVEKATRLGISEGALGELVEECLPATTDKHNEADSVESVLIWFDQSLPWV